MGTRVTLMPSRWQAGRSTRSNPAQRIATNLCMATAMSKGVHSSRQCTHSGGAQLLDSVQGLSVRSIILQCHAAATSIAHHQLSVLSIELWRSNLV